jgi:Domain of unknown function (DUF1963)
MIGPDDLSGLSETQLVQAYIENVQSLAEIEHIGAYNRQFGRCLKIVDELKARSATLQPLRGLLDHPNAEVRRWAQSDLDQLDRPSEAPPQQQSLSSELQWQCDNPPPRAMSRAEIAHRLRDALPEFADQLVDLALPAIGLWPQRPRADRPPAASRLGGMPLAPPGWDWPIVDTEPLLFVGQIDCAELQNLPGAEALPPSGLLSFFGDHDGVMACRFEACDIAVHHWPELDRLRPAAPPIEPALVFPVCALALRPLIDLPDPFSRAVQGLLPDAGQVSRYREVRDAVRNHGIPDGIDYYCSFGKLLGWPALVQPHDLDSFGPYRDASTMRLLLQVDNYSNGEELHGWGPGGSLYFLIPEQDLRARRLERCEFEIQFT